MAFYSRMCTTQGQAQIRNSYSPNPPENVHNPPGGCNCCERCSLISPEQSAFGIRVTRDAVHYLHSHRRGGSGVGAGEKTIFRGKQSG